MKLVSNQLEAFSVVARTRNFTRAARELNISQSALSQRILNLENEISTTLFIRERAGIELTEAASELLRYCQIQDSLEEEFLGKIKSQKPGELAGVIRIAGHSTAMRSVIIPSLRSIIKTNEKVKTHLQTREVGELLQLLRSSEADYILLDHELNKQGVASEFIGIEKYVLVESRGYKGAQVYFDNDENDETTKNYLKLLGKNSDKIERHFFGDIYSIIDGVKQGLGRAVVPEHLIFGSKDLVIKNPKVALEIPLVLHYYQRPFYSQLHHAVVKSIKESGTKLLSIKH